MKRVRLAIMASHPIPYQAPIFRALAQHPRLDVMVFFGDDYGAKPRTRGYGLHNFVWKGGVTEGYPHRFVRNWAPYPHPVDWSGKINPGLIPALIRFRPDALMLPSYSNLYHMQSYLTGLLLGKRILYFADSSQPPPPGPRGAIKHAILSRLYRRVDAFLVIGESNRRHYRAYGVPDSKFYRFPYSVGNARFRKQADDLRPKRAELRARFGVPEGSTCVLYVGRLAPEKNLPELIRGVERAPNTFLLLAGTGEEQAELEALAQRLLPGRHHFAGFFNQDRLGEVYAAADIFALTSSFEPWGLVCNEAMNFGLPLVVSDHVGAGPDLVIPGQTGFIYPLGDPAALARALEDTQRMIQRDPEGVKRAALGRVDLYSEEAQARGVLSALGVEP